MGIIHLPAERRDYRLRLTLAFAVKVAPECIALLQDAAALDDNVARSVLEKAYLSAGCMSSPARYIAARSVVENNVLAGEILLSVLRPLAVLGVVDAERADISFVAVRKFFLGVIGWTPRVLDDEATLGDLASAWQGFSVYHGISVSKGVDRAFLSRMNARFPDISNKGSPDGNKTSL